MILTVWNQQKFRMQVVLGASEHNCNNKSIFRQGKWITLNIWNLHFTSLDTKYLMLLCCFLPHIVFCCNNRKTCMHPYTVMLRTCECVTSAASISQVPTSHLPVQASKTSLSFKVSQYVSVCTENWCSRRLKVVSRLLWDMCVEVLVFRTWKPYLNFFAEKIVQMNRQCLMGFTARKWRRCNSSPFLSPLIHMETHCSLRPGSATIAALCILQQFVVTLLRVFGQPHCLLPLMSACVTG